MRQRYWEAIQEIAPNCELACSETINTLDILRCRSADEEEYLLEQVYKTILRSLGITIADKLWDRAVLSRQEGPTYVQLTGRAWVFTDAELERICDAIYKKGLNDAPKTN